MFTGIVKEVGFISNIASNEDGASLSITCPEGFLEGVELGASIAVDGVCLTVKQVKDNLASFDAIPETLQKTTLGFAKVSQKVHLERSAKIGDEIGGHLLSGHIMGMGRLNAIDSPSGKTKIWTIEAPHLMKMIFPKGYIAIDGASLTVVECTDTTFTVHLIPETLERTHFKNKNINDQVNLEIDAQTIAIVHTVEAWLSRK